MKLIIDRYYNDIEIKTMSIEDSEMYRIIRNENKEWFGCTDIISEEMQKEWFEKNILNDEDYMFSIYAGDLFVGGCSVYSIDKKHERAEIGRVVISNNNKKNGYGWKSLKCLVSCANELLGVKYFDAYIKKNNYASINTFKKIGFLLKEENENYYHFTYFIK